MTIYKIRVDGGNLIPMDAAVAQDDNLLRATIGAAMPELANATIQRHPEQDGVVIVELVKRAAHKGAKGARDPLGRLSKCKGGVNPALQLWQQLQGTALEDLASEQALLLDAQITEAVKAGSVQMERMKSALGRLATAQPAPAPVTPNL